jgi:hypothetical protein
LIVNIRSSFPLSRNILRVSKQRNIKKKKKKPLGLIRRMRIHRLR